LAYDLSFVMHYPAGSIAIRGWVWWSQRDGHGHPHLTTAIYVRGRTQALEQLGV